MGRKGEVGGKGNEERREAGRSEWGCNGCSVVALLRVEMRFWRGTVTAMGAGRVTGWRRDDFRRKVRKRNIVLVSFPVWPRVLILIWFGWRLARCFGVLLFFWLFSSRFGCEVSFLGLDWGLRMALVLCLCERCVLWFLFYGFCFVGFALCCVFVVGKKSGWVGEREEGEIDRLQMV
jgi:hypothetical protein